MKYAYEVLVNISFSHTYFSNKVFAGLVFTPSSSTQLLFLNYGLLFKPNYGGFTIAYDANFNGEKRSREEVVSSIVDCRFTATLNDFNFYNYTAIAEKDISKKVFHFYNAVDHNEVLNKSLHSEEFVSEYDLKNIADFNETFFVKPFAILDLKIAPELLENYSLNFKAKETIWRYILMGEHLQSLNSPAIIDNNGKEPFDGPEYLKFSGTQGLAFRSKKAISFSETSVQNFQLVENFDIETGRYKVVMRALPKANPALITLINDENTIANNNYSEIFIN
jgi:hypothetical protein